MGIWGFELGTVSALHFLRTSCAAVLCGSSLQLANRRDTRQGLQVGTYVIVRKLVKAIKLNGMTGKILDYDGASGRYSVLLTSSLMLSSLGKATAIKAANLEAISPEEEVDMALENDPYFRDLTEQQLDDICYGETSIDDFGNPHLRRLASKFLKDGLYLKHPQLMDDVSLRIYLAREREALEITGKLEAGTISGEELKDRILTDPEIEWFVEEFKRKNSAGHPDP